MLDNLPLNLTLLQYKSIASIASPLASLDSKCVLNTAILELSKRFFSPSKEASFEMAASIF